jgi:transcriptional regulator with XRE-family HTH domain
MGLGLSQDALAHLADLDRSYYSKIERGLSQPTLFAIIKIARALGFKAATLLRLTERELATNEVAN